MSECLFRPPAAGISAVRQKLATRADDNDGAGNSGFAGRRSVNDAEEGRFKPANFGDSTDDGK
ncbi:MAG: hypothetical protein DCC68_22605 [Planctomycetota bacterium]|nr:MAG: hypothetical protein DCC68_22605 [Planctomycetota bacterium]